MRKILETKALLIVIICLLISFIISFVSNEIVLNVRVHNDFLQKKQEAKYNEYKDLDIDFSEFEDELSKYETRNNESSYDVELFYYDLLLIIGPFILVLTCFGSTFLILSLFHNSLNTLRYTHLLKSIPIAYLLLFIPEILSSIYFLIFKQNYEFNEVGEFESNFYLSSMFEKENASSFIWNILSETSFLYLLFPFIVAQLLRYFLEDIKISTLVLSSYISYLIVFILYNTVFWYLFDLV